MEVICLQDLQKRLWAQFQDLCVQNKAVFCEVQTHFGSSLPPRFTEKVLGAIPRFFRRRTKLFAVKFTRILKVLCLRVLRKSCGRNSTIFVLKNEVVGCEIQAHFGVLALRGL